MHLSRFIAEGCTFFHFFSGGLLFFHFFCTESLLFSAKKAPFEKKWTKSRPPVKKSGKKQTPLLFFPLFFRKVVCTHGMDLKIGQSGMDYGPPTRDPPEKKMNGTTPSAYTPKKNFKKADPL